MTSQPHPGHPGHSLQPPHPASARVGDYTLLARIGEGGMGVVHLARRGEGDRVALKVLRPHIVGDDEARRRLAREVASLARVRSRWVAEVLDADPWAPVPYVATRYVPGYSLHDYVPQEGPVEGRDLLWLAACLAEGIDAVHAVGVLHRDVKPSNVLMEGRTPILIDFGLARVADDPRLTHVGWLLGTPGYLAPEILYGDDATPASDVHAWAATVAYAATGRPPFGTGPSMAVMDRTRRGQHDLAGVAGPLRDVLAAALHPEPGERPTLEAILRWLRPQTTAPGPLLAAPPTGPAAALDDQFTAPLAIAASAHEEPPPATAPPAEGPGGTRLLTADRPSTPSGEPPPEHPPPARPSFARRLRRGVLVVAASMLLGVCGAALPWVTAATVLVAVWLLRSGSLAAEAASERRWRRGRRWYDVPQLVVQVPWHLLQSVPGTLLLALWSAGLAVSAALVCYAVAAGLAVTLGASGTVLVLALYWGPGATRVRSPLARVVDPVSDSVGAWLFTVVVLLLLAGGVALWVQSAGVTGLG